MSHPSNAAAQALPADDQTKALIHALPPVFPFAWAVAHGWDRWGLWQAFELAGQRQRLRWLPPGSFLMGSPNDEHSRGGDERQHPVRLSQGLWLADTTVTQALWAAVLGGDAPARFKGDAQCPVESVSWRDVVGRFLPALNAALPGLAARLPTEAEWEYGCREAGRATGPFSFGGNIGSDQVNYDGRYPYRGKTQGDCRERTVPVGSLPANASGLFEMHGNVWEWCADAYEAAYPQEPVLDPCGAGAKAARRVLRGGGWFIKARDCRSAMRFHFVPGLRSPLIGFRLARGPLPVATAGGGAAPRRAR